MVLQTLDKIYALTNCMQSIFGVTKIKEPELANTLTQLFSELVKLTDSFQNALEAELGVLNMSFGEKLSVIRKSNDSQTIAASLQCKLEEAYLAFQAITRKNTLLMNAEVIRLYKEIISNLNNYQRNPAVLIANMNKEPAAQVKLFLKRAEI